MNTYRALFNRELSNLNAVALPALPDGGRYDHPTAATPGTT
ncbi:hypothetical protein [Micromonospora pallida]|nr:hypothetical protein [Micromonospora pallida]